MRGLFHRPEVVVSCFRSKWAQTLDPAGCLGSSTLDLILDNPLEPLAPLHVPFSRFQMLAGMYVCRDFPKLQFPRFCFILFCKCCGKMRNTWLFLFYFLGPTQSQTATLNSMSACDGCSGGICPGKQCQTSQSQDIPDAVQPIVDLLVLCGDQPNALTTVLTAMIEKEDNWESFSEASCIPDRTTSVSLWLGSVYKLISSFIDRAIKPAMSILLKEVVDPKSQCGFIDSLKELPCGCRLKQKTKILKETGPQEDMFSAMLTLITTLADNVSALPTPLCIFFNSLQQRLNEKEIHCTHDCIGLQVIIWDCLSKQKLVKVAWRFFHP